jgi:hypothetical protein
MAAALQQQQQHTSLQNMWTNPTMLALMQEYYAQMTLGSLGSPTAAAALLNITAQGVPSSAAATVSTPHSATSAFQATVANTRRPRSVTTR